MIHCIVMNCFLQPAISSSFMVWVCLVPSSASEDKQQQRMAHELFQQNAQKTQQLMASMPSNRETH